MKRTRFFLILSFLSLIIMACYTFPAPIKYPTETALPPTATMRKLDGEPVPWRELAFDEYGSLWEKLKIDPRKQGLTVIQSKADIEQVRNWVRPEYVGIIENIDYSTAIVLILSSGSQDSTNHGIKINQIVKTGNTVTISSLFVEPAPNAVTGQVITHPYLILEIERQYLPEPTLLILNSGEYEIDRYPHPEITATPAPSIIIIPEDQTFEQAAIAYISRLYYGDPKKFKTVDIQSIEIPVTKKRLWSATVVNLSGNGGLFFEVNVDEQKRLLLTGKNADTSIYWDEAETLFRASHGPAMFQKIAATYDTSADGLNILTGTFHYYPLTEVAVWSGKISSANGSTIYRVDFTLNDQFADVEWIEKNENAALTLKYGLLSKDLYHLLLAIPDDQRVDIVIMVDDQNTSGKDAVRKYLLEQGFSPTDQNGMTVVNITKKAIYALENQSFEAIKSILLKLERFG